MFDLLVGFASFGGKANRCGGQDGHPTRRCVAKIVEVLEPPLWVSSIEA